MANKEEEEKVDSEDEEAVVEQKPKKRKLEDHIDMNQVMTKSKVNFETETAIWQMSLQSFLTIFRALEPTLIEHVWVNNSLDSSL